MKIIYTRVFGSKGEYELILFLLELSDCMKRKMRIYRLLLMLQLVAVTGMKSFGQDLKISFPAGETQLFKTESSQGTEQYVFSLGSVSLSKKNIGNSEFTLLKAASLHCVEPAGKPAILSFHQLIPSSRKGTITIQILEIQDTVISLPSMGFSGLLLPASGPVSKAQDPGKPVIMDSLIYGVDRYYPFGESVRIERAGILRDQPLASLSVYPVQYNAVRSLLHIIFSIRFKIVFEEPIAYRSLSYRIDGPAKLETNHQGKELHQTKDYLLQSPIKYVILADSSFRSVLQPFVRWKTRMGFRVIEGYKGTPAVGSTRESMKAWLTGIYTSATTEDPAPGYLLICGDEEQIPAFENGHYTDLYYAEYDGDGDYFPDLYYGRFSAQDTSQLKVEINKTIEYEQFAFPSAAYLDTVLLIAGDDASYAPVWGNGQINYATSTYFNQTKGFYSNTYLYPSGAQYLEIIQKMNRGNSFVNYTGHGFENRWQAPYFIVNNVDTLKNYHKYSLYVSNGCNTNSFGYPVCLGEALLRAPEKGAIGHIGGTDDTYWDEDFYWAVGSGNISANPSYEGSALGAYDRTMHTHQEPSREWYPAQGQMVFAGNLAVSESGSDLAKYYWEVYTLLGDPSLMVYYGNPSEMECTLPSFLVPGSWTVTFGAEPGSYIGVSCKDKFLAAGFVDSTSKAAFTFNPLQIGDSLDIVVTKQNRRPVIRTIPVINPAQAYLTCDSILCTDSLTGKASSQPDYGTTVKLGIQLNNRGNEDASGLQCSLSSLDPYVSVIDSSTQVPYLGGGQSVNLMDAFIIHISDTVPDQHKAWLELIIWDDMDSVWITRFPIKINAPLIHLKKLWVDDSLTGNGNQRMEPGELFRLKALVSNDGHAAARDAKLTLSYNPLFTRFNYLPTGIDTIEPLHSVELDLSAQLDTGIAFGTTLDYQLTLKLLNQVDIETVHRVYGIPDEGFETGDFSRYPWISNPVSWIVTADTSSEGAYSARSGRIGSYGVSDLSLDLFVPDSGWISFDYKVSSEVNYDFFYFFSDSELKIRDSGKNLWKKSKIFIPVPGWHHFVWRYAKDGNTTQGSDCVWLDNIRFPRGACTDTVPHAEIAAILHPAGDSAWKSEEPLQIRMVNRGFVDVTIAQAGFIFDGQPEVIEYPALNLTPGESRDYSFNELLHLDRYDEFSLTAYIIATQDSIVLGDTMFATFSRIKSGIVGHSTILGSVWPNPASGIVFLRIEEGTSATYELLDIRGRKIETGKVNAGEVKPIDISELASGMYIIRLRNASQTGILKLMVRH